MYRISKIFMLGFAAAALLAMALPVAAGVVVGGSSLFRTIDYGDTFTGTDDGGAVGRPYIPALQPPPAYVVESTFGNPRRVFAGASFSFASDALPARPGLVDGSPTYPGGDNASGAGSDTGFTQTGGGVDYGIWYAMRDEYVVQVDAVQVADRIDITSSATAGTIWGGQSLSVFFRGDGSGNASLFNTVTDTPIRDEILGFDTGITGAGQWHNYAVRFDSFDQEIEIFVDEVSRGVIDLTTFAGGIYQGFSNRAVSVGGSPGGGNRTWTDNFQVGGGAPFPVHPDPGNIPGLPAGLVSYWDFNEAGAEMPGVQTDYSYDRQDDNDGTFQGTITRTAGLIGLGAYQFNGVPGDGINVGADDFSTTDGIAVEALIATTWGGTTLEEIFRKEDGGNRILLSFQPAVNIDGFDSPGLSLGLNIGGAYAELDMPLDGVDGRPTLAELADGSMHHIVASYDVATGEKVIWIDGESAFSVNLGAGSPIVTGGATDAIIGNLASGGEPFNGIIDEVAFWSRALSAEEIATHYANVQAGNFYFIPEPSTLMMVVIGLGGLLAVAVRRRRRRSQ